MWPIVSDIELYCQWESGAEALSAGELNQGFNELTEVVFTTPSDVDCQLTIDDEPMAVDCSTGTRAWTWKPGFFAGEVRAELLSVHDAVLGTWRLDVCSDDDKLGKDTFDGIVAELLAFDEELVLGQEPATRRLGSLGTSENPLVALARLRIHANAILQACMAVSREPIHALRSRRHRIPLHLVRRADRQTAMAALREPELLSAVGGLEVDESLHHECDVRANVPHAERHYDSAANRCIVAVLHALVRRCENLRGRLEELVVNEKESGTVTSLAQRWSVRQRLLDRVQDQLKQMLRRRPFNQVSRAETTAAGLNAVAAHPLYARVYRLAWLALRGGFKGEDPADLLPLSPTWGIYERWCFVRLVRMLQEWLPEFRWEQSQPRNVSAERCWQGSADGVVLQLLFQPRFRSTNGLARDGCWSVSGLRIPDIVLLRRSGSESDFFVLDAKYRASRSNVLDAMASAHIYQDSLRYGDQRPIASLLLIPDTSNVQWLENEHFVGDHRVGVARLDPATAAPSWLRTLLLGESSGRRLNRPVPGFAADPTNNEH